MVRPRRTRGNVDAVSRPPTVGNLPAELTSFVGRRRELVEGRRLVSRARLVTLTGVGGVGKSRLALRLAYDARRGFADGVWLVGLAEVMEPSLLPHAVSAALGLTDCGQRDQAEALAGLLADRQLLLVLDSCEHLLPACAEFVAELLRVAPGVRVLATSREVLRVAAEQVLPVAPLPVPGLDEALTVGALARYPGVALFAERAAAVCPGFALSAANAAVVARICRRLDGIPLALELAAARLRALSLEQVASRLDDRFRLLSCGNRTAVPRQQTLRATVEWSFELCAKPERLLWLRCAVFVGRFDLEAAERVCGGEALATRVEVRESLVGLVDKSVLVADEHPLGVRYRLLDTLRRYGLDRLADADPAGLGTCALDEEALRVRHLDFYLELAERFHVDWFGPRQAHWTQRMRAELADLRAALEFSLSGADRASCALRLAAALYYFWYGCGETREGRYWLERALAADPQPSRDRMRALAAYGRLLILQGRPAEAVRVARDCEVLARRFDDGYHRSHALQTLGLGQLYRGDPAAMASLREAAAVAAGLGANHPARAFTLFALAVGELLAGDRSRADGLLAESGEICVVHGDQWWLGNVLTAAANAAVAGADAAGAGEYGRRALQARRALHDTQGMTAAVESLAWAAAVGHDYRRAARLLGAADRQWQAIGGSPYGAGQWLRAHQRCAESTRRALGPAAFEVEFGRGAELDLADAVGYASGVGADPGGPGPAGRAAEPALTRREREVAELVAQGLTNRRIAGKLVVSTRTVESHVEHILAKLGLTSRTQVATWFRDQADASG